MTTNYDMMLASLLSDKGRQETVVQREEDKLSAIEDAIKALLRLVNPVDSDASNKASPQSEATKEPEPSSALADEYSARDDHTNIPEPLLQFACRGKSIADAAIAILAVRCRPLSEQDLLELLERGGTPFSTIHRRAAVRSALLKKAKETNAVKETGPAIWGLSAWKETSNPNHLGFVSHRDKSVHMERSLKGLQAALADGKKLGRTPRINEAFAPQISEMLDSGETKDVIAKKLGVTRNGLHLAIKRLRREGVLPPDPKTLAEGRPIQASVSEPPSGN